MEFENITFSIEEGIARITLNQPDRRNSLSYEMVKDIEGGISLAKEKEAKVLVLTGSGKAFSSGGDMKSMAEGMANPSPESREKILDYYRSALAVRNVEVPTIAAINGHAIGAGLTLALACDIRIAKDGAKMGPTFVQIGLNPGMGTSYLLQRVVGIGKACELIFTASVIEAREAERIGLVNKVVPEENFEEEVMSLASKIAKGPPLAIRMAKKALRLAQEKDMDTVLEFESFAQGLCLLTDDLKEGIQAFFEKREPEFKGK